MTWQIPLADLEYDEQEKQAVAQVLESRWLTMGAQTQEFETEFAKFIGVKHALALANATVALHLACVALGIGPGDEVIVPSLTFVATSNAVLYTGARVRFADIGGDDDLTIAPDEIEKQITPRTRAISVMHYGGYPCRMNEIRAIAAQHHLPIIEDAAHAPGASIDGVALGAWGQVGCFSFFSNKNLATGEGGMLVTHRDDLAERVRLMRSHGMTSLTWDRHRGHAYSYDVVDLGYNYRIDEIRAALGLAQLRKLAVNNARRKIITEKYWQLLAGSDIGLPFRQSAGQSACHIFPVLLPPGIDRKRVIDQMRADGIQTSIHYPPIHQFTYYRQHYPDVWLPKTESAAARELTLPLYPSMSDQQIEWVVASLTRAVDAARAG